VEPGAGIRHALARETYHTPLSVTANPTWFVANDPLFDCTEKPTFTHGDETPALAHAEVGCSVVVFTDAPIAPAPDSRFSAVVTGAVIDGPGGSTASWVSNELAENSYRTLKTRDA